MRPCPACARRVQDAAPRCHYCGAAIPRVVRAERAAETVPSVHQEAAKSRAGLALWIIAALFLIVGLLVAVWH